MLRELHIENLAIIEKLDLEFEDNLIVLTGETGAGKSIILNGINLLIGERASVELIRDGADFLLAEGVFAINDSQELELAEKGIEVEDSEIIVQRRLEKNGKGKAFINGRRIPLTVLREIMDTLVDLVGQHTHQVLLNKSHHIKLIDRFFDTDALELKNKIKDSFNSYNKTIKEIQNLKETYEEFKDKKELFEFQINEINALKLIKNEDVDLEDEYKKLFNSGKIKENLHASLMILKEDEVNALKILSEAKRNIERIMMYGKEYEEMSEKLEKVYYELEDVVYYISDTNSDTDSDEYRLNEVVDRLDKINNLKKKYGNSIDEILEYKLELEGKLDKLGYNDFELEKLKKEKNQYLSEYNNYSEKLTIIRKEIANKIEKMLIEELKDLKMESARFKIFFNKKDNITPNGQDEIEFMITTNIGQDFKPLTKIVSGGEVSRIMLSLKSIFSKVDRIPILIFDEIDTGVGGETVRKVAEKLRAIGNYAQVVCITHSPAIASKAKQQFYIEKNIIDGQTVTSVNELNDEERVAEIARMIAGDSATDTVLTHAKELLKEGN